MSFRIVKVFNETLIIGHKDGYLVTPTMNGEPISLVNTGLTPHSFFDGFPIYILELVDANRNVVYWLFSNKIEFIGDRLSNLSSDESSILKSSLEKSFKMLWADIMDGSTPTPPSLVEFMSLTIRVREDLFLFCKEGGILSTQRYFMNTLGNQDGYFSIRERQIERNIDKSSIINLLMLDFVKLGRNFHCSKKLSVVSCYSHSLLYSDTCICATEAVYWYKFYDERADAIFYIIATLHHTRPVAVYLPESQTMFWSDQYIESIAHSIPLDIRMLWHLAIYAPMIKDYLAAPSRAITLLYGEEHLAHHLWNELGGLNNFLEFSREGDIPEIYEMSAKSEMFGPFEDIFPEVQGKVIRYFAPRQALLADIYTRRLCIIRPTTLRVTNSLRQRISNTVDRQPYIDRQRVECARLREVGYTIITFMIRIENRTFANSVEFYSKCADYLLAHYPYLCIVIDGHSTRMHDTHDANLASNSVSIAVEEVSAALQSALTHQGCLVKVCVNKPVGISLFWLRESAFFISPWGAGMAKSRWATNRPGIFLTNTWNLRNHHDLHLYDNPAVTEDPAPLLLATEDVIIDRNDIAPLVYSDPGFGMNFDVKFDLFTRYLDEAIKIHRGSAQ